MVLRNSLFLLLLPILCFAQWGDFSLWMGDPIPSVEVDTASVFNAEYVVGEDSVLITIQHFDSNMTKFSLYAQTVSFPNRGSGRIVFNQMTDTTGFTTGKKIYFQGTGETFYFALYHYGYKFWTNPGNLCNPGISPDDFTPLDQPIIASFDTLTYDSTQLLLADFDPEPKTHYWLVFGDTLAELDTSGANIGDTVIFAADTSAINSIHVAHHIIRSQYHYLKIYGCDSLINYFTTMIDSLLIPEIYAELFAWDGTDSLNIKWNANADSDSVNYYLLYRKVNAGNFALLDTIYDPDTSYVDKASITSPNKYWYYVTAVNDYGESDRSDTVWATIPEIISDQIYYRYASGDSTDLTIADIIDHQDLPDDSLTVEDTLATDCDIKEPTDYLRIIPSPIGYKGAASFVVTVTDTAGYWVGDSLNIKFY